MPARQPAQEEPKPAQRRFRVPWGLVLPMAAWAALMLGYASLRYWGSDEYAAAEHVLEAKRLLGADDGRSARRKDLTAAYEHVLEAARLMPERKELLHWGEGIERRFEDRAWEVPGELHHRAEMLGARTRQLEEANEPTLAVGLRDRGWDPNTVLEGPGQFLAWSSVGFIAIAAIWVTLRFSYRRRRALEHEENLRAVEREIEELGAFRRGLKNK